MFSRSVMFTPVSLAFLNILGVDYVTLAMSRINVVYLCLSVHLSVCDFWHTSNKPWSRDPVSSLDVQADSLGGSTGAANDAL